MNKQMAKEELLVLPVKDLLPLLSSGEKLIQIAKTLGAFWTYDYKSAEEGRVGMHALLKSGLHSDGFFVSKILLGPENIRRAIAQLMVECLLIRATIKNPDYVAGVPDGATSLGSLIAGMLPSHEAKMRKVDGRIVLESEIPSGSSLLLVEDFCTRGTGFKEAVKEVKSQQPLVELVPYDPVIINRGGLKKIQVEQIGTFEILPLVEQRIQDWDANDCSLCKRGSIVIKPKATDENWHQIATSQFPSA